MWESGVLKLELQSNFTLVSGKVSEKQKFILFFLIKTAIFNKDQTLPWGQDNLYLPM